MKQKTIRNEISIEGKGIHLGRKAKITIKPADINTGYIFKRTDIEGHPVIRAIADNITNSERSTIITENGVSVSTIEHLLAATYSLGIDNVIFEINNSEVPILDGSSKNWLELYKKTEIIEQNAEKVVYDIKKTLNYTNEFGTEITVSPNNYFSVTVDVDFNIPNFPSQTASLDNIDDFEKEISPSRTFVFLSHIEHLVKAGLIKGGDLNNAIIIVDIQKKQEDFDQIADLLNMPHYKAQEIGTIFNNTKLFYPNEQARHKLLDLIGDLALTGIRFNAKVKAKHPGHFGNTQMTKIIKNYLVNL